MSAPQDVFSNPTTLQVFLHLRQRTHEEVGIRELQRELKFGSPSTASWHFNKLEEAGLALKLSTNRYVLTDKGLNLSIIDLPVNIGHYLLRGHLIPPYSLLLVFHGILIILLCYTWIVERDLVKIAVTGSLGVISSFVLVLIFWFQIKNTKKLNL